VLGLHQRVRACLFDLDGVLTGNGKNALFHQTLHSAKYVQVRVDGVTMREEGLPGKPAPDSFLRGAQLLDASPSQAAVFEDAIAGVAAGRDGHIGVVIGVDRVGQAEALRRNGADTVVADLAELLDA
jgi:beta-phosphoglucomutase-like phosphatase (HAD superfamily)